MSYGFRGPLPPSNFNMARYCLAAAADRTPDKTALVVISEPGSAVPGECWTYRALETAVLKMAGALKADGLSPGARIMIRLENTSDYAILFFGALAAGVVPLPASSLLNAAEAAHLLADSEADAIALAPGAGAGIIPKGVAVYGPDDIRDMRNRGDTIDYAQTTADSPAFLIYTSGTTARPKGVLHAHRSAWGRRPMYDGWYGITQEDRMLHTGAFNWTYTLGTGLTDPWANGATAIVYTGAKDPAIWPRLIRETEATLFAAVPSLYRRILKYTQDEKIESGRLRHALTAGETLSASVAGEWLTRTGIPLYEALGMSELSTYISSSPTVPPRKGCIGKPQPAREIAILPAEGGSEPLAPGKIGLLAVHRSDPALMLGYWKRPEEEKDVFRGEWFCGGDLARIDGDGYVVHEGRSNDLMNAFGYRVSPLEVEQALLTFPGVTDVAAGEIRVRDDVSVILAFVVCEQPGKTMRAALMDHAEQNLASYKRPKDLVFVDDLPHTPNGKVRRADLQDVFDRMRSARATLV